MSSLPRPPHDTPMCPRGATQPRVNRRTTGVEGARLGGASDRFVERRLTVGRSDIPQPEGVRTRSEPWELEPTFTTESGIPDLHLGGQYTRPAKDTVPFATRLGSEARVPPNKPGRPGRPLTSSASQILAPVGSGHCPRLLDSLRQGRRRRPQPHKLDPLMCGEGRRRRGFGPRSMHEGQGTRSPPA